MSAPVMIIRAKGPQDLDLVVNPEVTFFKAVYPRHSNFAFEDIELTHRSGSPGYGNKVTFTLSRSGDLVSHMMLYFRIDPIRLVEGTGTDELAFKNAFILDENGNKTFNAKVFVDDLGHALIDSVSLKIGGYEIEKLTGDFMHVWSRLTSTIEKSFVDNVPVQHGGVTKLFTPGNLYQNRGKWAPDASAVAWDKVVDPKGTNGGAAVVNRASTVQHIYVPLIFTCCSVQGQALPIIALQYHDVDIEVNIKRLEQVSIFDGWKNGADLVVKGASAGKATGQGGALAVNLLCRYIFLDDWERKSFALSPHNYLITETQYQRLEIATGAGGAASASKQSHQLHFNHPVKELVMFFRKSANDDGASIDVVTNYWNFTIDGNASNGAVDATQMAIGPLGRREAFMRMNLSLNQQKLYGEGRDPVYFGYLLPQQYHTKVPDGHDRVYIMPFGLDPECWKPTGSINFSRIDNVQLLIEYPQPPAGKSLPAGAWHIYARNHNTLKIQSGMGGKRYAS